MVPENKKVSLCFKIGDFVRFKFNSIEVIGIIRNLNQKRKRATIQIPQTMVSVPIVILRREQDKSKYPKFPSFQIGDLVHFTYNRNNGLGYVQKINKTTISINSEFGVIKASYSRVTPALTNKSFELLKEKPRSLPEEEYLMSYDKSIIPLSDNELENIKPTVHVLVNGLLKGSENLIKDSSNSLINLLIKFYDLPNLKVYTKGKRKIGGNKQTLGEHRIRGAGTAYEKSSISVYSKEWKNNRFVKPETFLKTLIHEFMHHYDRYQLSLDNLSHSKGFEARVNLLYDQILQLLTN
ncbi:hypothetical protein [Candidatus Hodarchaeum mangrovi]